jgi:transcriptional regulator GlxA family with amidase domain
MTRRIVLLAFDGCQPLDVVGPHEAFATSAALKRGEGAEPPYEIVLAGLRAGRLTSESGLGLFAAAPLASLLRRSAPAIDTLIVTGGAGARRAATDRQVVALVARAAGRARRVTSVCTGAFVLAGAGLLDGRRATTHWAHCDELAALRPAVTVEPDPIYVRDGRFWTSAGVTAGIDLALALIEDDLGPPVATAVARALVVFVRRAGGQSQFSAQLAVQAAERAPLRELQSFIVEHPEARLDVPALARRVAMSVRHFSRLFRAQVGVSPASFVETVRLETARRLLETTVWPIEQVADGAGFGTPEALRRTLSRRLGLSPREYRARFGPSPSPPNRGATSS